jgi:hypothetical protein
MGEFNEYRKRWGGIEPEINPRISGPYPKAITLRVASNYII